MVIQKHPKVEAHAFDSGTEEENKLFIMDVLSNYKIYPHTEKK